MINYKILNIRRAVFHKVMARQGDTEPYVEPSKSLIDINPEVEQILRTRMADAFGQGGKSFELAINEVESGSAFSCIVDLNGKSDREFLEISIELAEMLACHQDRSIIPSGFLVVLDCENRMDGRPVYVLMKAEPHDALEIRANTARALKDIILSPSQKMYKAACFQKVSNNGSYKDYKVYLFDEQFGTRARMAEYFYKGFLGLTVSQNDMVLTKMFYYKMIELIKDIYSEDFVAKEEAEDVLKAEMINKETKIVPLETIKRVAQPRDVDSFIRRAFNEEIPSSFRKDISLITGALVKRTVAISKDIKISVPQGMIGSDSIHIDRDSDKDYYVVKIPKAKE